MRINQCACLDCIFGTSNLIKYKLTLLKIVSHICMFVCIYFISDAWTASKLIEMSGPVRLTNVLLININN